MVEQVSPVSQAGRLLLPSPNSCSKLSLLPPPLLLLLLLQLLLLRFTQHPVSSHQTCTREDLHQQQTCTGATISTGIGANFRCCLHQPGIQRASFNFETRTILAMETILQTIHLPSQRTKRTTLKISSSPYCRKINKSKSEIENNELIF